MILSAEHPPVCKLRILGDNFADQIAPSLVVHCLHSPKCRGYYRIGCRHQDVEELAVGGTGWLRLQGGESSRGLCKGLVVSRLTPQQMVGRGL